MSTTKSNKPVLPPSLKVSVLSGHIDWTEPQKPVFRYLVELGRNGERMTCDYSGGIMAFLSSDARRVISSWGEDASPSKRCAAQLLSPLPRRRGIFQPWGSGDVATEALTLIFNLSKVKPLDVVYSLTMDAQAGAESFEDFCSSFGCDPDSRKAFATWGACKKAGADLRRLCGDILPDLETMFQDY